MLISSLVLELWQFPFIREWPEIQKSEIPPSEFRPLSGDWGELGIPNLAQTLLIKCYWMLQNARVMAFTVSELLRGNLQKGRWGIGGGAVKLPFYIYMIRLKLQGKFFNLRIQYIVEFFSNLMLSKSESSLVTAYRLVLELSICIMLSHLRE